MVSSRTRQILLKLRRVEEAEARRVLSMAEVDFERAATALAAAKAAAAAASARLDQAAAQTPKSRAGDLADRERYLDSLRVALRDATAQRREMARVLAASEQRFGAAQEALGAAVHASEAALREDRRARDVDRRLRDRRLEGQAEDRWRPRRDS